MTAEQPFRRRENWVKMTLSRRLEGLLSGSLGFAPFPGSRAIGSLDGGEWDG